MAEEIELQSLLTKLLLEDKERYFILCTWV